jgi:hypothetical protein
MKEISKSDFDNVSILPKSELSNGVVEAFDAVVGISPAELEELERQASVPSNLQKSLVAKLGAYVDFMFKKDLKEKGYITDYTRKFIELYNSILSVLHKELYGEKQVNVGTLKVTHSMIMSEVRKSSKIIDAEVVKDD